MKVLLSDMESLATVDFLPSRIKLLLSQEQNYAKNPPSFVKSVSSSIRYGPSVKRRMDFLSRIDLLLTRVDFILSGMAERKFFCEN